MAEGPQLSHLHATARGLVQGVFFRAFVAQQARALGLTGYVRNLADGRSIEVVAEGPRDRLEELLRHLRAGPRGARVDEVEALWSEYSGKQSRFEVRP